MRRFSPGTAREARLASGRARVVPAGSWARVGPQEALRYTATPSITSTSARSSWALSIDSTAVGWLVGPVLNGLGASANGTTT